MAIERYNPKQAETRWQRMWEEARIFETDNDSPDPKYYVLEMFPYPSGRIHMGHVRNYAMGDVVARYKRAKGFNVLHPMGWDAFGMPAENAAIQNKVHPRDWTYANIDAMRKQLKSMGLSLDWSREFATCDVDYYKQQQALFLDFLKAGLIYRRNSKVNWDPVDMTVLANEQVIDGRGWRSGALVEQRELTQWFFRISDFAEDLLTSLDELDQWPEKVRLMQKNWIGKSEGLMIAALGNRRSGAGRWCQRHRGLHHPPRHPLWRVVPGDCRRSPPGKRGSPPRIPRSPSSAINAVVPALRSRHSRPPRRPGFETAVNVVHPLDPDWTVPVYIANFVLMDYGTGAIFGCPSGDQRDLDFARKYNLPVTPVVMPADADAASFVITDTAYVGDGVMINSRRSRRHDAGPGVRCGSKPPRKVKSDTRRCAAGGTQDQFPPARLGTVASALLGRADPGNPL
jgi:leucyl-tRNA synthetase